MTFPSITLNFPADVEEQLPEPACDRPVRERHTERRGRAVADEWLCIVRPWGFLSARSVSIKLALVNVAAAD